MTEPVCDLSGELAEIIGLPADLAAFVISAPDLVYPDEVPCMRPGAQYAMAHRLDHDPRVMFDPEKWALYDLSPISIADNETASGGWIRGKLIEIVIVPAPAYPGFQAPLIPAPPEGDPLVITTREELDSIPAWEGRRAVVLGEGGSVDLCEYGESPCVEGLGWCVVADLTDCWPEIP